MTAQPLPRLSYEAYLEMERASDVRHEFHFGDIYAMGGASFPHNVIAGNIFTSLKARLRGSGCMPFMSEVRVQISRHGLYVYPDVGVTCGPEFEDQAHLDTLLNPLLVVEVLSKSTAAYDRNRKFAMYRQVPSLQHYLLVEQTWRHVELYTRQPNDTWLLSEAGDGDVLLSELDVALPVDVIYDEVEVPDEDPDPYEPPRFE